MGYVPSEEAIDALRSAGARFILLFGSHARGDARPGSDIDLAALFLDPAPANFQILLPTGYDLLVLNSAPLELAGRVALEGRLLFEVDPAERVRWLASTRKIYSDEKFRFDRAHRDFSDSRRNG